MHFYRNHLNFIWNDKHSTIYNGKIYWRLFDVSKFFFSDYIFFTLAEQLSHKDIAH